ncbi:MAG: Rrf2 family transcriptional regulator [archaeon]|nr:Rrf2 family transcriptional regulator [archaeon]
MEQIGMLRVKAGFIKSIRGSQGGYLLTREPREYSIGEIVSVTEGELNLVPCVDCAFTCDNNADCLSAPFWKRLNEVIDDSLHMYYI